MDGNQLEEIVTEEREAILVKNRKRRSGVTSPFSIQFLDDGVFISNLTNPM